MKVWRKFSFKIVLHKHSQFVCYIYIKIYHIVTYSNEIVIFLNKIWDQVLCYPFIKRIFSINLSISKLNLFIKNDFLEYNFILTLSDSFLKEEKNVILGKSTKHLVNKNAVLVALRSIDRGQLPGSTIHLAEGKSFGSILDTTIPRSLWILSTFIDHVYRWLRDRLTLISLRSNNCENEIQFGCRTIDEFFSFLINIILDKKWIIIYWISRIRIFIVI